MKQFMRKVRGALDAVMNGFKAIAHLSIFCGELIYRRKLQALHDTERDIRDLLIWRNSRRLPELDFYLARNKTWVDVNEEYHQGTWKKTKELLFSADLLEDKAAASVGLNVAQVRFIGSNILGSIGHMSFGLAMRARMQVLGDAPVGRYFTVGSDTANDHLLRYWGKYFTHLDCTRLACRGLEETMWPLLESIQTLRTKHGNLDIVSAHNRYSLEYERLGMPPLLSITDEDLDRLQRVKVNWGIADRWLAVLHVRWDGLASRYGRNAAINDYLPAIKKIVTNGGAVIRIGSPAMPKLPKMEGVIDYAHDPQRLPWLDIAAIASSRFVVCTTSGPIGIAPCFGVPILWTNMPDIGKVVFHPKVLTIPKLVRDPDGQTLSLEAMFKTGSAMMDSAPVTKSVLRYNEYSWIDNSPQDIADGVDEMLKNTWANPPCEQDKLWRETLSKYGTEITSRPSPIFLKKYCNILFER